MTIGIVIICMLVLLMISFFSLVIYRAKDRKESLTIMEDGDVVRLFLSDDNYDELDIAEIKDNKEKVYEEIKKLIQYRSKELFRFVNRVTFFNNGNLAQENELLNIILSAKA